MGEFMQEWSQTDRARCLGETVRWLTHLQLQWQELEDTPWGGRASGAPGVSHQTPEGSRRIEYGKTTLYTIHQIITILTIIIKPAALLQHYHQTRSTAGSKTPFTGLQPAYCLSLTSSYICS